MFPNYIESSRPISKNSVLANIKAKREAAKIAALQEIQATLPESQT